MPDPSKVLVAISDSGMERQQTDIWQAPRKKFFIVKIHRNIGIMQLERHLWYCTDSDIEKSSSWLLTYIFSSVWSIPQKPVPLEDFSLRHLTAQLHYQRGGPKAVVLGFHSKHRDVRKTVLR
jgi:hypothetical protein